MIHDDLGAYRKSYEKSELTEKNLPEDPMEVFQEWFHEVAGTGALEEPNAMTVATSGLDGFPKSRVVLLKTFNSEGFTFYTNYESEKGRAIAANPRICLSFFWPHMERQVIVKGTAKKVSPSNSDSYFDSRPEGSKLGALASAQSSVIASRKVLEDKVRELEDYYRGKKIKRPPHWGGYLVQPLSIEFWQGRPDRLHDRIRFTRGEGLKWKMERLAP